MQPKTSVRRFKMVTPDGALAYQSFIISTRRLVFILLGRSKKRSAFRQIHSDGISINKGIFKNTPNSAHILQLTRA